MSKTKQRARIDRAVARNMAKGLVPLDRRVQAAIDLFNAQGLTEEVYGRTSRIYARRPILAEDCDYEIVSFSGVQGRKI